MSSRATLAMVSFRDDSAAPTSRMTWGATVSRRAGEGMGIVLVATLVKLALWKWIGEETPAPLYLVAVAYAAFRGGVAAAAAANAGAFVLGAVLFARPYGVAEVELPRTVIHLFTQLAEGVAIAWMVVRLLETRWRALHAAEEAREIARKERRSAGVVHDVGNLLAVVVSCVESARRVAEEPVALRALDDALVASLRAGRLTRRLVVAPRHALGAGGPFDLAELVRNFEPIARRITGDRVALANVVDAAPLLVDADDTEVEQILLNLVVNACEAMPDGGELRVAAGREEQGGRRWVTLSVRDTGRGMSPETRERAFSPHFSTKGSGAGLGLAVVEDVVGRHGGSIDVETGEGGTTVLVRLPERALV